jgi:hypothetical protein
MEAVAQASVRGFHEVPARPGQESDAAQGNTERPGIALARETIRTPLGLSRRSQRFRCAVVILAGSRRSRSMRAYVTVAGMAFALVAVWAALVPFVA